MSPIELEPLPTDVAQALDFERKRPGLTPERHRLLTQRIALAVAASAAETLSESADGAASASVAKVTGSAISTKVGLALFAAGADESLAKELAMLEVARTALARGNASLALEAAEKHAKEFSSGRLAEERESVAIQALLALGRTDRARTRADSFRRDYPESMLRPLIDGLMPKGAARETRGGGN